MASLDRTVALTPGGSGWSGLAISCLPVAANAVEAAASWVVAVVEAASNVVEVEKHKVVEERSVWEEVMKVEGSLAEVGTGRSRQAPVAKVEQEEAAMEVAATATAKMGMLVEETAGVGMEAVEMGMGVEEMAGVGMEAAERAEVGMVVEETTVVGMGEEMAEEEVAREPVEEDG